MTNHVLLIWYLSALFCLFIHFCYGQPPCVSTDRLTQSATKSAPLQSVKVSSKTPVSGYFFVKTDIPDTSELGGYATSRNASHDLCQLSLKPKPGISFFVDTSHFVQINARLEQTAPLDPNEEEDEEEDEEESERQKRRKAKEIPIVVGRIAYLINRSDSIFATEASDSRIDIVLEARDNGEWREVEYLPVSWCGNSYHRVYLKPGRYWSFGVPLYKGNYPVLMRYRFDFGGVGARVYSNEFAGTIHKGQMEKPQKGRGPRSMRDPYYD